MLSSIEERLVRSFTTLGSRGRGFSKVEQEMDHLRTVSLESFGNWFRTMFESKSAEEKTRSHWNDLRIEPRLTKVGRCEFGLGEALGDRSGLFFSGVKGRSEGRERRVGILIDGRVED